MRWFKREGCEEEEVGQGSTDSSDVQPSQPNPLKRPFRFRSTTELSVRTGLSSSKQRQHQDILNLQQK